MKECKTIDDARKNIESYLEKGWVVNKNSDGILWTFISPTGFAYEGNHVTVNYKCFSIRLNNSNYSFDEVDQNYKEIVNVFDLAASINSIGNEAFFNLSKKFKSP